jgi:thiol-disulfide isomerase/thioredoxin
VHFFFKEFKEMLKLPLRGNTCYIFEVILAMNHTKIMIKKNSISLFVCFLLIALSFGASAQKGKTTTPAKPAAPSKTSSFTIKGKIEGLRDTALYLGNYYGKSLYYNDTCRVDANGNFEFKGKKADEIGKYAIIMPGPKYFDIIVDQENIVINASSDNDINKVVVKESESNKLFFEYIRYINAKRSVREPIDKALNDSTKTEEEKKPFQDELKALNDDVLAYQNRIIEKHPELLFTKLLKMGIDPVAPAAPDSLDEQGKARYQYYWFREHYWDNVDFSSPAMIRDQTIHRLIERYITQTLPQIPDTLCVESKKLIDKVAANPDLFKYFVHFITYTSETSKIMCMDRLFVFMVDNYYETGKVTWMDEAKLKQIKESAAEKRNCLCGNTALDIILPDQTGQKWVSMKETGGKYTLLVIWESTCGHCKKEVPKLLDLYHKYQDKGLVVYAIGNELENDKWVKFIDENKLDWINVSDTPEIMKQDSATTLVRQGITTLQSLNYRTNWDVNSTPKVYLMDKDYKIIAKQLSAEQLDELIQRMEEGKEIDLKNVKEHEYEDEDAPAPQRPNGVKKPGQK